jgi:hypothetical protein
MNRIITMTFLISFIAAINAAAEKYVISAAVGSNIVLKTIELDQNQTIRIVKTRIIETTNPIFSTAITSRYDRNNRVVFDVYYVTCTDPGDISCEFTTLSMVRVDRELRSRYSKNFNIPTFTVSTAKVPSVLNDDFRIVVWNGRETLEYKLKQNGFPERAVLDSDQTVRFPSIAEDGRFVAGATSKSRSIAILPFDPKGPVQKIQINTRPAHMVLSGPLVKAENLSGAGPSAKTYRQLFFRSYKDSEEGWLVSRVMRQKIDEATGKFIGKPKPFTDYAYSRFSKQSLAITPEANIVLYTLTDDFFVEHFLYAQVFDPVSLTCIGQPQPVIGFSEIPLRTAGADGIDIAAIPEMQ